MWRPASNSSPRWRCSSGISCRSSTSAGTTECDRKTRTAGFIPAVFLWQQVSNLLSHSGKLETCRHEKSPATRGWNDRHFIRLGEHPLIRREVVVHGHGGDRKQLAERGNA